MKISQLSAHLSAPLSKPIIPSIIGFSTGFALTLGVAFSTASNAQDAPATVPSDLIYSVKAVQSGGHANIGGAVIPAKMVKLLAQMPGTVDYVAGEEGDHFKSGEKLATQDIDALLAKRRAAEAGLRSAQAGVGNAMVQYNNELLTPNSRANGMLGGVPSMFSMFGDPMQSFMGQGDPDYQRHSNLYGQSVQIQTAQNQVAQAKAGLAELDANIENAVTVAPFDGVILKKMIQSGDVVQPGMPLFVFANTSHLQVQSEIPAHLVLGLKPKQPIKIKLNRRLIDAKVARIFPMADPAAHTTTVKFDLPAGTAAQAGMYADVMIPDNSKQATQFPAVPTSAISWRGSLPAVFIVSDDNSRLRMRTVRLGKTIAPGQIAVISGIKLGDRILRAPLASTRSGPYVPPPTAAANSAQ